MKQIFTRLYLHLLALLLLLVLGAGDVWGAWTGSGQAVKKDGNTYYVVYETGEQSIFMSGSKDYTLSGPGKVLTFSAKRSLTAVGNLVVSDDKGTTLYNSNPSTSWTNYTGSNNCNVDATKITFSFTGSYTRYFKNVKVTMAQYLENPSATSLNCGTADINSGSTNNSVTVAWCNVPAMTCSITGTDEDLFSYSITNNSEAGKYNTATITVTCNHNKRAGNHSATLTISDSYGNYSKTVSLSSVTNKLQPTVTWSSNDEIFNVDDELSATNSNDLTVTLSSAGNEEYVRCTDNTATMLKATTGKITINAHVTGNNIYADKDFPKEITITSLEKQHITWTQDLSRLKTTDATKSIVLNATASSGLPVTYELQGDKTGLTLTQNGNTWTLTYSASECKNTTIVAHQAGNSTYAPASGVSMPVKVIDPTKVCDVNEVLVNSSIKLKESSVTYNIDIPASMRISLSRVKTGWLDIYINGVDVEFYSGRNGSGTKLYTKSYEASDIDNTLSNANIDLSSYINAKSVKVTTNASNGYYLTSLTYTKQKYCNLSTGSLNFATYPNTATSAKTFNVNYANYPISLECSNNKFTFSPSSFGDCSEYGSQTISVTYTAGSDEGNDVGYIYVKDNTGTTLQTCTLNVAISKVTQSITSTTIQNAYNTTDRVELGAVANSGLTDFTYSATPSGIASFDGNVMTFSQSGTIAITVSQAGSNVYRSCSTTVNNITINKVTPTIATEPTVATIKYLDNLNNNQLSDGLATVTFRGVANTAVAGKFEWTNTKQITDKAGNYTHSITFKPTNTGMYNNKVFDQTITISRADASIVMNDGSVKVSIAGVNNELDETRIDLDDLIASQTTDAISASRAGAVSYKVLSDNAEYASIDGNHVFVATRPGEYTIEVTKAQTDWYVEAKDTFVVKVEKLDPVVVFDNTDDPQVLYTLDIVNQPAARYYNGHKVGDTIVYVSENQQVLQVNNTSTRLKALEVQVNEGESVAVTVNAHSAEDDFYNQSEVTSKHYAIYAKRSPHFTMEGQTDVPVSKTLKIGETATITYNDFTDASFTVGTSGEHGYVTFTNDTENRIVTITAVKGNLSGDGEQVITLNQPGTDRLYQRQVNYTFTVQRHVSTMSLEPLTTDMHVEDTVSTIFANLANTADEIQFTCSPEGSMKYEDGKLIALRAGMNTVTFTQSNTEYWTGITQSRTIAVTKLNPQLTWFEDTSLPWYASVRDPFTSTNTMEDCPITITSSDETLAKYIAQENKIVVYGTSGTVTFTLNQPGNYKYTAIENATKTFTIFKPNNGLPCTLTSSNWTNYRNDYKGSVSWNGGGILCGDSKWDWSAKYVVLSFTGVPNQLSFDFQNSSIIATQYGWHFYQSSTGNDDDWQLLKEYADQLMNSTGGTSEGSETFTLDPNTRYIKLEYHGNYGGRFTNISISERKEITPKRATEDFGLGYNGNEPTDHTIPVDWYNVNNCRVYIDGADADRFILSEEMVYSTLNSYGTANLHVSYKHDVNTASTHTAILHIEEVKPDGTYGLSSTVTLVGQTTPAPQVIIWRNDLTPMPSEGEFTGAAYSTSGLDITLTSLNPDIVRVGGEDGLTLYPVAAGIAQVQAYQAGDEKWAEITDVLEIEVTNKHVQFITWNQNLSNLKRNDGATVNVTLNATTSSELPITYELDAAASQFASVNGNVLTLTGWGTGTITAIQAGNDDYVAVRKKKTVVSRNPNAGCRPLVGEYYDEYVLHTIAYKEIELNGEPATVEFDAKCDWDALNGLWVAEYYDNYWHQVTQIKRLEGNTIGASYKHFGPYDLNRNSTAVKLYTETGATLTRTFKNVEVTMAKYLELDRDEMNFSQMDKGATKIQSFYINYSNITGVLDVELANPSDQFEVMTTTVGEDCGDAAKNVRIDIKCTGKTAGTEENEIIVSNVNQVLRVPVTATVVLPSQAITWTPDVTERNILTTDVVTLDATATSGLAVNFTSLNTEVAEVAENAGVYSLNIHKYGDVTVRASQAGNDAWSPAVDKDVVFHISRVVPVISAYPTTESIFSSRPLSECTLNGGTVEGNIPGEFRWVNPDQVITIENTVYQAMFLPENTNYYEPVVFNLTLDVISNTQTITWSMASEINALCADVIVFDAVASSELPITYISSDSLVAYVENSTLRVIKYGTVTITATQEGDSRYLAATPLSTQINLTRNSLVVETKPEIKQVYVGHSLSDAKFVNDGVVKAREIVVDGKFSWQEDPVFDVTGNYIFTALFTPYNIGWYEPVTCDVTVEVIAAYIFTGNGSWDDGDSKNWQDERQPDGGGNDELVVAGTMTVTEDDVVELQDLTVSGELILDDGASVTVTGNLIIEAALGGKEDELTYIPATSGQLSGEELSDSIKVGGDVYFQLTFDPRGYIDYGWYDFVLPFDVDIDGGLFFKDKTPMVYGVDFMMAEFSESKYAKGEKGWWNYRGTMLAGKTYTITFDETRDLEGRQALNTVLFKKKDDAELGASDSYVPEYTPSGDNSASGWNGIGNGTLTYRELNRQVQIYDHITNTYTGYDANEYKFAVGTSFFVQANPETPIVLEEASESRAVLAPAREQRGTEEFRVALTAENANYATDRLWFSASEDATEEYVIGKDLAKMGTPTDSKVARMWTRKGEIDLCDIETVLNNNQAEIELSFFAPKNGTYELAIEKAPENSNLFLTYNGRVIWDLTFTPYMFDLTQGTTDGYGLLMDVRAPYDTQDIDNTNAEGQMMRKVLIDNMLYVITPEGVMYDATGKIVKHACASNKPYFNK